MRHDVPDRLDQLADGCGVPGILVDRKEDQAAELVLTPVGKHGWCERTLEADHHHRADLLPKRHPARAEDGLLVACRWGTLRGGRSRRWMTARHSGRRRSDRG